MVSVMFMTVGFYMLVPYLAAHLQQGLGFTAGIIGLVLGVRTFCQQGLYAVGGSLSDRLGCRSLIVAGALVRATGFLLFGFATTLPIVFVAAVLTGFGGVLFGPASRSYLAQETVGEHRVQTLALDGACTKIGELIGPLVGLALLAVNFQLVSLIATGVFTLLALFVLCLLPYRPGLEATSMDSALLDWRHVLSNRVFLLFALSMGGGWLILANQIYVSLPLEIERLTGSNLGVSVMFTLSCLMVITTQGRITAASRARWRGPRAIVIGLSLMTIAFVPLMIGGALLPLPAADGGLAAVLVTAVNLAPIVLWTLVFTLGVMIAQPFAMDLIPLLGGERRTGTYYGVYFSIAGLGVLAGNPITGLFIDLARAVAVPSLPWLFPLVIGLSCTILMRRLNGRGVLPARQRLGQMPETAVKSLPDEGTARSDRQGDSGCR